MKPLRRCAGCGAVREKESLLRIGAVEGGFCFGGGGRGAYVCKNADCAAKVVKKRGLDRSFRRAVPCEVYENLKELVKNFAGDG